MTVFAPIRALMKKYKENIHPMITKSIEGAENAFISSTLEVEKPQVLDTELKCLNCNSEIWYNRLFCEVCLKNLDIKEKTRLTTECYMKEKVLKGIRYELPIKIIVKKLISIDKKKFYHPLENKKTLFNKIDVEQKRMNILKTIESPQARFFHDCD
ncbi:MAG: hypothetical protein ACFE85_17050 [Candidatus Hodarchaeota archaeon]